MDRKEFFKRLVVDLPLYSTFNSLRDALFNALAVEPRKPMLREVLDNIIAERALNQTMDECQMEMIKTFVKPEDEYRLYTVSTSCNIDLLYIVNMSATSVPKEGVIASDMAMAAHQMVIGTVPESGGPRTDFSVICLAEKHELMTPAKYPKIIKHELVHAAITHIAADHSDIREFVRTAKMIRNGLSCIEADDNLPVPVEYEFIELVCNIVPYLSLPVKKENGIDKFMEDAVSVFGYAEDDPLLAEGIAIITEVKQEAESAAE